MRNFGAMNKKEPRISITSRSMRNHVAELIIIKTPNVSFTVSPLFIFLPDTSALQKYSYNFIATRVMFRNTVYIPGGTYKKNTLFFQDPLKLTSF
jgi:hypothetical protein